MITQSAQRRAWYAVLAFSIVLSSGWLYVSAKFGPGADRVYALLPPRNPCSKSPNGC